MGFCYELDVGCSGCRVRTTVCIALCHYMFYGVFVECFVFTNICYPPFYYVDFLIGGSAAALSVISFLTAWVVDLKECQFLRGFATFFVLLAVLATVASTFYYVIERWNDVEVTAMVHYFRSPPQKELPDILWFTFAVIMCINTPIFLFYLPYILSFMCNTWKSFLFTSPYMHDLYASAIPVINLQTEPYSSSSYKPYPVQRTEQPTRTAQES